MSTALTPYEPQQQSMVVRPVVDAQAMLAAMQEYEALKRAIILQSDLQKIGDKVHIKKSGWLRIARAFNLTCEVVSAQYERDDDGTWGYAVIVRAIAPNGASMTGDGMCWSTEKIARPWIEKGRTEPTPQAIRRAAEKTADMQTRHNVRAHAVTRATNRAISNLVGGGEVSAEEIGDYVDEHPMPRQLTPQIHDRETPANTTAPSSPADDLSIGEFVREAAKLGLNSKQITERLGVLPAQFHAINRRAALEKLAGVVESKPEPEPVEIAFVEEDHSQEASVAQDAPAEAWNALADVEFRKLCNQAGLKSIAGVEGFLGAQFSGQPYTREQATEGIRAAMAANGRTPDLATLPAQAVH